MLVYKIRRPDGLFSTGGCEPRFTKAGKTWRSIGHVKTHLKQFYIGYPRGVIKLPKGYERSSVCCYEMTELVEHTVPVRDFR
ncbi:hypothetical protein UFOVP276_194 [uncultured Caudovirales phage]|uniref:Uncharacterized protein n=1 Tax=uncultured Caudovirales phage TaxID=2100421 RepID=A0A6J5LBG2_9CAUD|nr:hypothetical protein UFOVP127_88 [uncultured Caudovirales phage]CAB4135238.1 hypothetical protein UFOVP276_194 [uncultured Caudovirales phage]